MLIKSDSTTINWPEITLKRSIDDRIDFLSVLVDSTEIAYFRMQNPICPETALELPSEIVLESKNMKVATAHLCTRQCVAVVKVYVKLLTPIT